MYSKYFFKTLKRGKKITVLVKVNDKAVIDFTIQSWSSKSGNSLYAKTTLATHFNRPTKPLLFSLWVDAGTNVTVEHRVNTSTSTLTKILAATFIVKEYCGLQGIWQGEEQKRKAPINTIIEFLQGGRNEATNIFLSVG